MVFLPFLILIAPGVADARFLPKSFETKTQCMEYVKSQEKDLLEHVGPPPEGAALVGGCLGIDPSANAAPRASNKATDPNNVFYDPLHPENLSKTI